MQSHTNICTQFYKIKIAAAGCELICQCCQIIFFRLHFKGAHICENQIHIMLYCNFKYFLPKDTIELLLRRCIKTEYFIRHLNAVMIYH